jgi:hypothetical protein
MARPKHYKIIDEVDDVNKCVRVMATDTVYGIKSGEQWVVLGELHHGRKFGQHTKYKQLFVSNRKQCQNQCDRLNDVFDTDQYRVVEVMSTD